MVRIGTLVLAWVLVACAAAVAPEGELALEAVCGGAVTYFEWRCAPDGWRLERVGEREWSCAAPHALPLAGRTAVCQVSSLHACDGSGDAACETTRGCAASPPNEPCNHLHD